MSDPSKTPGFVWPDPMTLGLVKVTPSAGAEALANKVGYTFYGSGMSESPARRARRGADPFQYRNGPGSQVLRLLDRVNAGGDHEVELAMKLAMLATHEAEISAIFQIRESILRDHDFINWARSQGLSPVRAAGRIGVLACAEFGVSPNALWEAIGQRNDPGSKWVMQALADGKPPTRLPKLSDGDVDLSWFTRGVAEAASRLAPWAMDMLLTWLIAYIKETLGPAAIVAYPVVWQGRRLLDRSEVEPKLIELLGEGPRGVEFPHPEPEPLHDYKTTRIETVV